MLSECNDELSEFLESIGRTSHYREDTIYIAGQATRPPGTLPGTYAFRAPFKALMEGITREVGAAYRMRVNPRSFLRQVTLVAVVRISDPEKVSTFLEAFRHAWDVADWTGELKWADMCTGTEYTAAGVEAFELFRPKGSQEFALWRSGIGEAPAYGAIEV